MIMIMIAH